MWQRFWRAGLALALALTLPLLAADDKADDKKNKDKPKDKAKAKAAAKTEPKEDNDQPEKPEKPAVKEKLYPVAVRVGVVESVNKEERSFRLKVLPNQPAVPIHAVDDVKVRLLNLPVAFDAKGKPRRYTSKELSELKGPDRKLPGYQADFDSLRANQRVQVQLVKKKGAVTRPSTKKKKDDEEDGSPNKILAGMIVIVFDPPPP